MTSAAPIIETLHLTHRRHGSIWAAQFPSVALGLAIGYFAKPNSAVAMVNLIYLPLSFCSGLWIPVDVFSHMLQKVAHTLPAYHFGQLVLNVVGVHHGPVAVHLEVLTGFALIWLGIARLAFQRDEGQLYG